MSDDRTHAVAKQVTQAAAWSAVAAGAVALALAGLRTLREG